MLEKAIEALPAPLNTDQYSLLSSGIYDSAEIDVYVNEAGDFAFLYPVTKLDYTCYEPRVKTLGLTAYKSKNKVAERRYAKVKDYFSNIHNALEIGASDAAFLAYVHNQHPEVSLASLEPDQATKMERDAYPWLQQYDSFEEVACDEAEFDLICMFHVFEHIMRPELFLTSCLSRLALDGRLIIEVPSLDDPLLTLYGVEAYKEFYFQRQHPYVYSSNSLQRVLEHNGCIVESCIYYQRYGLENHLTWMTKGKPGGDERFRTMFAQLNQSYVQVLEMASTTDTVIVIARKSA